MLLEQDILSGWLPLGFYYALLFYTAVFNILIVDSFISFNLCLLVALASVQTGGQDKHLL